VAGTAAVGRELASPAQATLAHLENVHFSWRGRNPFSISIADFTMRRGERLLLVGPSGSGKSTFLSLLCGIVVPSRGTVRVLDTELPRLSSSRRDRFRAAHMGIVFQMFNLLPYGSIRDNVVLPLTFSPARRARCIEAGGIDAEYERLVERLGLDAKTLARRSAAELSVGQQQRVAVARALIGGPELMIADEPTSSLDRDSQASFLDLLFAELGASGAGLLMVSHDQSFAHRFDRVVQFSGIARGSVEAAP
jgi:putative ABC transport system ATP-binding protein